MDFFMPFCTNPPSAPIGYRLLRALAQRMRICCVLLGMMSIGFFAQAQAQAQSTFSAVRFDASDDGIRMSGSMHFSLSEPVLDTLQKGVAVYFVFETKTTRKRWYWSAETLLSKKRYMRLTYQPITRRWRLNMSNQPLNQGAVGVLHNQNYNSLDEALAVMQRISSWQVLKAKDWKADNSYDVQVQFSLDVSQLRRPMQIGTAGQSGWKLALEQSFVLDAQHVRTTPANL